MNWINNDALKWALEQLVNWGNQDSPAHRAKQVLYRLLLLRQLGVNTENWTKLSTADFSRHCKDYLLVSDGDLAGRTGGNACYFVPLINKYQRAGGGSDWAVGTMWTRRDVWVANGVLLVSGSQSTGFQFKFSPGYVTIFKDLIGNNLIPALPLALYLLRRKQLNIDATLNEEQLRQALINMFFEEFKMTGADLQGLFSI
jgi:hypothetical protein